MKCPACEESLSRADYVGQAVGLCSSCNGSWLTGSGFAAVTRMDGTGFQPRDVVKLKALLQYKVDKGARSTDHPCPRCGKKLKARNYANIAGFFIEQCPGGCGVWVREGDLDRIRILRSLGRFEEVKTRKPRPGLPAKPAPAGAVPAGSSKKKKPRTKAGRTSPKRQPAPAPAEEDAFPGPEPKKGFFSRLFARFFGKGQ